MFALSGRAALTAASKRLTAGREHSQQAGSSWLTKPALRSLRPRSGECTAHLPKRRVKCIASFCRRPRRPLPKRQNLRPAPDERSGYTERDDRPVDWPFTGGADNNARRWRNVGPSGATDAGWRRLRPAGKNFGEKKSALKKESVSTGKN